VAARNDVHIRTTRIPAGAHLVTLAGELDLYSAPSLREEMKRLPDGADVVVDLDALTFVDSIALGVLLSASHRLRQSGGCLLVVCEREEILRVFQHMRLDSYLQIEPSLDDALRYVIGRVLLKRLQRSAALRAQI
jgi:anti-sigma B factor antagonist